MKQIILSVGLILSAFASKAQCPGLYLSNTSSLTLHGIFQAGNSGSPCVRMGPSYQQFISTSSYYSASTASLWTPVITTTPAFINEIKVIRYVGSTPVASVYQTLCLTPGTYPITFPGVPVIFMDVSLSGSDFVINFHN
ncbi:MAG: hypothetical protein V4561_10950 [Bacteroidota bacterium]